MEIKKYLAVFTGFTLLSRFLGLARDVLIAYKLGATVFSDIFFVAFRLPNLFRSIFAEGALNGAFLPIYAQIKSENGPNCQLKFAYKIQVLLLSVLFCFLLLAEIFMQNILFVFAPGLMHGSDQIMLLTLARVLFPYIVLISLVSLYTSLLQSKKKFGPGAFCPAILNIFLIYALLLPINDKKSTVYLLALAVVSAGCVQLLYLLYKLKQNDILPISAKFSLDNNVKKFLKRFLPAVLGAEVYQLNIFIDTFFASSVLYGVSYLYYADRIVQLPLALIGVGLNVVILPLTSSFIAEDKFKDVIHLQNKALNIAIIFGVPATIGLIELGQNIIESFFVLGGQFSTEAAKKTADALKAYSFALPAYILNKIFIATFFAKGEAKKPVIFALVSLICNLVLNFILVGRYGHVGIAVASVVAAWVNFLLLIVSLKKQKLFEIANYIPTTLTKVFFATAFMIFVLQLLLALTESYRVVFGIIFVKAAVTFVLCFFGFCSYFLALLLLNKLFKKTTEQKC